MDSYTKISFEHAPYVSKYNLNIAMKKLGIFDSSLFIATYLYDYMDIDLVGVEIQFSLWRQLFSFVACTKEFYFI